MAKECDVIYVMYEIDHVLVIGFTTCMSMIMTTGRSLGVVLIYCINSANAM